MSETMKDAIQAAIREAIATVLSYGNDEWRPEDTAGIILDESGRFATVATFGSDHGVARLTEDGVLVVFDAEPYDDDDMVGSVLVTEDAGDGSPMLMWDYLDADALRAERERA